MVLEYFVFFHLSLILYGEAIEKLNSERYDNEILQQSCEFYKIYIKPLHNPIRCTVYK